MQETHKFGTETAPRSQIVYDNDYEQQENINNNYYNREADQA